MSAKNNNHGNKDRQTNDHLYIEEHVQHDHRLHTFYTVLELNVGAVAMKNVFLLLAAMGSTCTCHYAASVILPVLAICRTKRVKCDKKTATVPSN